MEMDDQIRDLAEKLGHTVTEADIRLIRRRISDEFLAAEMDQEVKP